MSPIRQPLLAPIALLAAGAALGFGASASAGTYGRLLVRHSAAAAAPLETRFAGVRAPHSFLLVVTEPKRVQLNLAWSVHCVGPHGQESGGASGRASVGGWRWVKRISPSWIKHPVSCSGTVDGSAGPSPVLVRVYAD